MDLYPEIDLIEPSADGVDALLASSKTKAVELAVRELISATGDGPDREGLRDTPARVLRAWREWFSGYVDSGEMLRQLD